MKLDCHRPSNKDLFWIGYWSAQDEAPQRIADRLALPLIEVVAAQAGYAAPRLPSGYELHRVLLSAKDRTRIAAEALRREVEMPKLASSVLAIVVRDDLFEAVL